MQTEEKEFKVELKRIFRGYRRAGSPGSLSRICSSWAFGSWTAKNIIRSITGTIPIMPSSLARLNPTGGPA